ncbi:phosphopyruvate hydratase [Candidatus Gracilibacteria bacterium]|nr:phosphopyruvate hydratase [Candidatus Gracilibacteria bacterium]
MYKILNLYAREVLDSRGNPTVEVELEISNNKGKSGRGRSIVPSGASTGIHEALELRDGDEKRFGGKGVLTAVNNVNEIIKKEITGKEFDNYEKLDQFLISLDGTENKSKLGANAILAVSMAFVVACANSEGKWIYEYLNEGKGSTLPYPMMNILNGGSHADNNVDIQEFMIVPVGANNLHEAIKMGAEVFHSLKKILNKKGMVTSVGDEGGYAPNLASNEDAFRIIMEAINKAGYNFDQIKLAIDAAASEFYKDGKYNIDGKFMDANQLVSYYEDMVSKYPIISIEDSHAEDDFEGRKEMMNKLGDKIMIVGDDLFVTNIQRLEMGIKEKMANSILIKLNQIGSVSETINAIHMANQNGMKAIVSHRSGETEDTFIADLAVAMNTGFIKTGSASRSERICKYNQLMRIEEKLSGKSQYGK